MSESQLELFGPSGADRFVADSVPRIAGLRYVEGFLSECEQARTISAIDSHSWRKDLRRRVQHYGWRYDYRTRDITRDMRIGDLPTWLQRLGEKLCGAGLLTALPDQAIINEYYPGQGIAMHVDRKCFGPEVATISMCDAWRMDLRPVDDSGGGARHILLEVGSVLVLSGQARYEWLHGISTRKREREGKGWRPRERRVSVTFRTVLESMA